MSTTPTPPQRSARAGMRESGALGRLPQDGRPVVGIIGGSRTLAADPNIVFAPGGAGTMQEIFQDAAQNADGAFGRSPTAFRDTRHYCEETGLYPGLERQAERLGFADLLSIGDEPEQLLERFPVGSTPPSLDGMAPEMLVRRMRNAR